MRRPYPSILLTLTLMALLLPVFASANDADLGAILKQFPGSHLLTLQERDADLRAFLFQHFPKDNPSVVRADLKGDGNPGYALLLKNDKTGAAEVVVLFCTPKSQCKSAYELDETAYAGDVYLRPVSAGSTVKLHPPGIQVNYFEKGKVVLHWNPKRQKIEELQTSD